MAERTPFSIDSPYPLVIRVRFTPSTLPPGAVNVGDLVNFLHGMQVVLDELTESDERIGHQQFAILDYQQSSADVFITLQTLLEWFLNHIYAELVTGGSISLLVALSRYVNEFAGAMGRQHGDAAGRKTLEQTGLALSKFNELLHQAVSQNSSNTLVDLPHRIRSGLTEMARVGAKAPYQREGILVSDNVAPTKVVTFDANALERITYNEATRQSTLSEVASEAWKEEATRQSTLSEATTKAWEEEVDLFGVIDEVSRFKHTFVLVSTAKPKKSDPTCEYPEDMENLVQNIFGRRLYVKVTGIHHYQPVSRSRTRKRVVKVLAIQPVNPLIF